MRDSWDQRIGRARQLAAEQGTAAPLLTFYARLLESQKEIYDSFHDRRPSGSLERDANQISEISCGLLQTVADHAPEPLSTGAKSLLERGTEQLLRAYSQDRSDDNFFGKAILQPYRQWMVDAGMLPVRTAEAAPRHCPRCDGAPQLAILDSGGASDEGSSRRLFCANCLAPWPFARIVCAYCGENDEKKLAYFHTPAFEHLRVDACDSCKRYLKSIDLTRLGLAVPLVDEVASAPLDLWAREQGYKKIELNLFGL